MSTVVCFDCVFVPSGPSAQLLRLGEETLSTNNDERSLFEERLTKLFSGKGCSAISSIILVK